MDNKIRWGIIGTGGIAKAFANGLKFIPDAELYAVGSRSIETAESFAKQFNVPKYYSSYEGLANDPKVDAVYISTPHNLHKDNSILCLKSGKAVLCEKPFTVNASEAKELIKTAREKKLFLMEAMWSRYLPVYVKVREWLSAGLIGEVRMLLADFGFRVEWDPKHRALNPDLAGGGLLDVGIYPISLAFMVFGSPPNRITGMAHIGETGVDEQSSVIFGYEKGKLAVLSSGLRAKTPVEAHIIGTDGIIKIHPPFFRSSGATLIIKADKKEYDLSFEGNGYNYEAVEVMKCMRAGILESPIMPLEESLIIMETMDKIRSQWGLKYPME